MESSGPPRPPPDLPTPVGNPGHPAAARRDSHTYAQPRRRGPLSGGPLLLRRPQAVPGGGRPARGRGEAAKRAPKATLASGRLPRHSRPATERKRGGGLRMGNLPTPKFGRVQGGSASGCERERTAPAFPVPVFGHGKHSWLNPRRGAPRAPGVVGAGVRGGRVGSKWEGRGPRLPTRKNPYARPTRQRRIVSPATGRAEDCAGVARTLALTHRRL